MVRRLNIGSFLCEKNRGLHHMSRSVAGTVDGGHTGEQTNGIHLPAHATKRLCFDQDSLLALLTLLSHSHGRDAGFDEASFVEMGLRLSFQSVQMLTVGAVA
ncbi:hypothetical protein [Prosthecobacter sp.]|uniref:hypothetical protein n=1 Tax=Prosthecobacter sp. TaxID=1965333 RepID=UPI002ABBDEA9|nr:hypothetical protein [Prosthecobacter sp.]MDZ4404522.1 hypothetical protein [Prosthecobacter sp.]